MKRKVSPFLLPAMPPMAWTDLAMKTGELLLASAQVIGHRTRRMAAAGTMPSARDQREFALMGQEKIEAAREAAWAMGHQIAGLNSKLGARTWRHMMAASNAVLALAASRSLADTMAHQAKLSRSMTRSAASASQTSDVTAKLVTRGLEPIHRRATANAKRLARN